MNRTTRNIPHIVVLLGGEGLRPESSGFWNHVLQLPGNIQKTISLVHAVGGEPKSVSQQERRSQITVDALTLLGMATNVIDVATAKTSELGEIIYLTGTNPTAIVDSLAGTALWDSICLPERLLIASSGAAVAIGERAFSPIAPFPAALDDLTFDVRLGLGLIPGAMILPYFGWLQDIVVDRISELAPALWLIGIDDQAALILHRNRWEIAGLGTVTIFKYGQHARSFDPGMVLSPPTPNAAPTEINR